MSVLTNIQAIQSAFKEAQLIATKCDINPDLYYQLDAISDEFRSVSYEGASFAIAQASISKNGTLALWESFKKETKGLHDSQIHVGLGWALASLNSNIEDHTSSFSPYMVSRVIDGYGYYYGIFKRRIAIRTAQIPDLIIEKNKMAFDQGLGRALWYLAEGNHEKLSRLISIIPENRHADLWRGVGIAFTYVGGAKSEEIISLQKLAATYYNDFQTGVALALHSRKKASSKLQSSSLIGEKTLSDASVVIEKISAFNSADLYSTSIQNLISFL